MDLSKTDLYEIAKLFFPSDWSLYSRPVFIQNDKLQFVVGAAIADFINGDHFFKFFGDNPMPNYTPYGWFDVLKVAWRGLSPATVEQRIETNPILRSTVGRKFRPWWQNPELF